MCANEATVPSVPEATSIERERKLGVEKSISEEKFGHFISCPEYWSTETFGRI